MSTPKEPENTQGSTQSGNARGGLVPPWQRGTGGGTGGNTRPPGAPAPAPTTGPDGQRPSGQPADSQRPPGPPPRGVVTAGEAAQNAAATTKLDTPGGSTNGQPTGGGDAATTIVGPQGPPLDSPAASGAGAPVTGAPAPPERFKESPTRNIARTDLPEEQLPNLDTIHHVDEIAEQPGKGPSVNRAPGKPSVRSAPVQVAAGQPLRAAVQIRRIDPWATFKISAVLSVVGFFIWMIAVAVLYLVLDGMGVWDQIDSYRGSVIGTEATDTGGDTLGASTIFFWAALLGAMNAILLTALATIGSYIYNLCADLIGGVEVTLADLD